MKNSRMYERAGHSLRGLKQAWRRELSLRSQAKFSLAGIVVLAVLQPALSWWLLVLCVLATACGFELMNAAFEALIDHIHPGLHPNIRIAKDIASSAAFVLNCAAFFVTGSVIVQHLT